MGRVSLALVSVFALMIAGGPILASEPAAPSTGSPKKASPKIPASPASARAGAHVAPEKKDSPVPATPTQGETLEAIVARVRKRLAMEAPRGTKPAPPRPPVVRRVTLEWRPSVVWPADLGGEAPPAAAADPNRVSLSWDAH